MGQSLFRIQIFYDLYKNHIFDTNRDKLKLFDEQILRDIENLKRIKTELLKDE